VLEQPACKHGSGAVVFQGGDADPALAFAASRGNSAEDDSGCLPDDGGGLPAEGGDAEDKGVHLPHMTAGALKLVADSPARKIGTVSNQRAHAGTGCAR
jgi:hypothetical protein